MIYIRRLIEHNIRNVLKLGKSILLLGPARQAKQHYIPIEIKWSDKPGISDAKHLKKFLEEYSQTDQAYIICRTPYRYKITDKITALPWQEISSIFQSI